MLRPTGPRHPDLPPISGEVDPAFREVAVRFTRLFRGRGTGGAALAIYHRDRLVVDIWGGYQDLEFCVPWQRDTMAMSFSTTKGVAATVIHRLADRGLIDYDAPVGKYWSRFDHGGREAITVRHLLSHQAGLHRLRGRIERVEDLLDHDHMIDRVSSERPCWEPGTRPGYHGITFGWLLAGLAREITGQDMRSLFHTEIAGPLGLDGLYLGAPREEWARIAPIFPETPRYLRWPVTGRAVHTFPLTSEFAEALLVRGFDRLWFEDERRILGTQMPAVNGVFTARSLAKMYAALANRGTVQGVRLLSPGTVHEAGRVQTRAWDAVLNIPMRWRLGYHHAFSVPPVRMAFGHFGYGGSGAWADPETGISLGFVTNRLWATTTPLADTRLVRLNSVALAAAAGLEGGP